MAVPNEASIVIHKTISKEDASAYYARRTSEALDLLFGDASVSNLPGPRVIDSIKKLKNAVVEPEPKWDIFSWKYATPVWNIIATDMKKLELIGLTQEEVETLGPILPAKTPSGAHPTEREKLKSELVPQILFVLKVLDYDEANFQNFVKISISRYPAVGIMICEILCDDKILAKARPFLVEESFDKKRQILFQFLKKYLRNCQKLSIIHMVASCRDQIENIVPDEMLFYFGHEKFSPWDMAAMAKVTFFSSLIKMRFYWCNINDESIVVLRDGLSKSNVKIHCLDISDNPSIDVKGWSCVGELVKNHEVEELDLSQCKLTYDKLDAFNKSSGDTKIRKLNISCNRNIGERGFKTLGYIVKRHDIDSLVIGELYDYERMPNIYNEITSFCAALGDKEIKHVTWTIPRNNMHRISTFELNQRLVAACELSLKVAKDLRLRNLFGADCNFSPDEACEAAILLQDFINVHHRQNLTLEFEYDHHWNTPSIHAGESCEAYIKRLERWRLKELNQEKDQIGSQLFEVHEGHIKFEPFETHTQIYQPRFPNLRWSIKKVGDLLKKIFPLRSKSLELSKSDSDLERSSEPQSTSKELWGTSSNKHSKSEGSAAGPKWRDSERHIDEDKQCFSKDWGSVSSESHTGSVRISPVPLAVIGDMSTALLSVQSAIVSQSIATSSSDSGYSSIGGSIDPVRGSVRFSPLPLIGRKSTAGLRSATVSQSFPTSISDSQYSSIGSSVDPVGGSQLFEVHEDRIKLEPFETRMQIYQERYPKLRWSSKRGEDLLEKRFPLGSKSPELSKSDSDLERSSEPQSTSKELWGTSSNKHSTSEGSAAGPKWRDSERHIDEDKQCFSKDWGSVSSESHTDHASKYIFPMETTVITVGNGAEIIHVGGCVVEFQAGSFSEPQEITVTAEINPRHWPPGREAITPTLSISANNLLKEATVKLHTWSCNGEDEEDNAEVWRHTKKENKWVVIKSCSTGESNFIEFKVSHFCSFVAILKKYFKSRNIIRPMVYHCIRDFVVALIKDTPLIRRHLHGEMEATIGMGMRRRILGPIKCKKSDKIKTVILSMPQKGFKFEREDTFSHPIQEVFGEASESYHCVALTSHLPAQFISVVIEFLKDDEKLRADTFSHYWDPGVTSQSKVESKPPEEEELSPMRSTPPPTNSGKSAISESQPRPNIVVHGDATFTGNNLGSGHVIQGTTAGMINEGKGRFEEHGTTHSIASTSRTT